MRAILALTVVLLTGLLLGTTAEGESRPAGGFDYKVEKEGNVAFGFGERKGKSGLYVTIQFKVLHADTGEVATDIAADEIVVEEEGKRVADLEISQPRVGRLNTVLAMDISGSMANGPRGGRPKIEEARQAAHTFLDGLHEKADTGLILFDHEMRVQEPPRNDMAQFKQHRADVRRLIDAARPGGGTAYLDAATTALRMVKPFPGRKAVLVMTDGVDMNSKRTLQQVIDEAKAFGVPVYTIGIGEPGKNEDVTTVLVLDHSGSMKAKASTTDALSKMEALHSAASRFVELMRPNARTTLLPFSSAVEVPGQFSTDKKALENRIRQLQPEGGTLLYDATLAGIETLMASRAKGKKAVVVLTDGKDEAPGSRASDDVVIDRAREAGVPLYMLGLGQPEEINEEVMKRMADLTGGKYRHAGNQKELIDLFEQLSIDIHDDGIDVASLTKLAKETGGKYVPVRDVSQLKERFQELSQELQTTYTVTFRSPRGSNDGTARGIEVIILRGGQRASEGGLAEYNVPGAVVPELSYKTYLILLVLVAGLLLAPAGLRLMHRYYSGS